VNPVRELFHAWEKRLAFRDDPERRVLSFGWGTEHLPRFQGWEETEASDPRARLHHHVERALEQSDHYFNGAEVSDFALRGSRLSFSSPAATGVPENDTVFAEYFPVAANGHPRGRPAVVVLPQWNAKEGAQDGLCRLINRFGIVALKLALPYHEERRPPGMRRADFTLSPNVGRTLQSCRQAVLDARAAVSWLEQEGHGPIGIVGTSLGSAIAFIAFAHDDRLEAGVFNHVSPFFADVVWRGISTRHVREGLQAGVDLDELRKLWLPLSPAAYYQRVKQRGRPSLLIHGRYDLSFPPDLSRELIVSFEKLAIEHERCELPCGHYTTAKFPFNWMDGLRIADFLRKRLLQKK
jgi:pimeloyl-ACP methyl ester carboxylesterase